MDNFKMQDIKHHQQLIAQAASSSKVAKIWMSIFETVLLPVLPSVLITLAPKILKNEKLMKVLHETKVAIQGIEDQADE